MLVMSLLNDPFYCNNSNYRCTKNRYTHVIRSGTQCTYWWPVLVCNWWGTLLYVRFVSLLWVSVLWPFFMPIYSLDVSHSHQIMCWSEYVLICNMCCIVMCKIGSYICIILTKCATHIRDFSKGFSKESVP